MYLADKLTSLSTTDVGKQLGNRDHSTVIHGRDKIIEDLKENVQLQNTIDVLFKKSILNLYFKAYYNRKKLVSVIHNVFVNNL